FTVALGFSSHRRLSWFPEATIAMLGGVCLARVFYFPLTGQLITFDPQFFFKLLLPPIVFKSGFEIKLNIFFRNFTTIMLFANLGTVINILVVCFVMIVAYLTQSSPQMSISESLVFGSVVSATDPVTTVAVFERLKVEENLYVIVVGVSILDDAISVIVFNLFSKYLTEGSITALESLIAVVLFLVKLVGSMCLGYILGALFCCYLRELKKSFFPSPSSEAAANPPLLLWLAFFLFIYCSYNIADAVYLSGIISSLFAGVAVNKYLPVLLQDQPTSSHSIESLRGFFGTWASIVEALLFFYMGASMFNDSFKNMVDVGFFLWSNFAFLVGRVAQIYPLSYLLNKYRTISHTKGSNSCASSWLSHTGVALPLTWQHMTLVAGLRGPIAFASAVLYPTDASVSSGTIRSSTGLTVFLSTFLLGAMTPSALAYLNIPRYGAHSPLSLEPMGRNHYSPTRQFTPPGGSLVVVIADEDVEESCGDSECKKTQESDLQISGLLTWLSQLDNTIQIRLSSPSVEVLQQDTLHTASRSIRMSPMHMVLSSEL
ncbi:hypothetical protein EON65_13975, partial [archaeon]